MDIFEKASRGKIRFSTSVGQISTEDLWELPLTSESKVSLNGIAKGISKELRESDEDNFVGDKTPATATLELKLEIVKHVIEVKIEEANAKKSAASKKERKESIMSIIALKQQEEMMGKSVEELTKMLDD